MKFSQFWEPFFRPIDIAETKGDLEQLMCPKFKCAEMYKEPAMLIHGGAGNIPDESCEAKLKIVKEAANAGYNVMKNGGTAVDGIETAIVLLENDPGTNSGIGSLLNIAGEVEVDASIMSGEKLDAGAVSAVKDIANPISLARLIMEKTPHVLLAGDGAKKFARQQGLQIETPGTLVTEEARAALETYKQCCRDYGASAVADELGPVGAVSLDRSGHLAAGASSGGSIGRMVGRCGDSPVIGCGSYADDYTCAVAVTGHGESNAKYCLSHSIAREVEKGKSAEAATCDVLENLTSRLKSSAGAITLTREGERGVCFTTPRMPWACRTGCTLYFGINPGEVLTETIVVAIPSEKSSPPGMCEPKVTRKEI